MPIRVKVERVGYYEEYPDVVFHDVLITQSTYEDQDHRWYSVEDRMTGMGVEPRIEILHRFGDGVGALVIRALKYLNLEGEGEASESV